MVLFQMLYLHVSSNKCITSGSNSNCIFIIFIPKTGDASFEEHILNQLQLIRLEKKLTTASIFFSYAHPLRGHQLPISK